MIKCGDCGSTNLVMEIEQPNLDEMCIHVINGRPGFMHPKSEPCALREAAEKAPKTL